jgi:hypothetical protein
LLPRGENWSGQQKECSASRISNTAPNVWAKRALDYYSREYAPYQYSYLRILEYARYRTAAQFQPGIIPYSEAISFVTDLSKVDKADSVTMHELAHMWWADRIAGAQIQGRWMLTESMAEYSRMMLFMEVTAKQFEDDGHGKETEGPLNTWFDAAVFPETDEPLEEATPLYIEKHLLRSGKQALTVYTAKKPAIAALDPFHKMVERSAGNNSRIIDLRD